MMRRGRRLLTAVACLATSAAGCSPTFWRRQADADVYRVEADTVTDPRWAVPRLDIAAPEGSRFADPHLNDCPPLPPDDPAAREYMHCVDGWKGYPFWDKNGQSLQIESPFWEGPYGRTSESDTGETRPPKVSLPEAIRLSQLHNRDYQFEIENVYLNALAVSFEQFRLGVRYLGVGSQPVGGGLLSTFRPGVTRTDDVTSTLNFGVSQLLPSGGQLIVELANQTVWFFGEGDGTNTLSDLSFSLTQPLLAGAGRKVNLEALTLSQRQLLYSLRDLARFRRTFFTDVVATGAGSGYLGLLEQVQLIRNQRDNIRRLQRQVEIQRALGDQPLNRVAITIPPQPAGLEFPRELSDQLTFDERTGQLIWVGPLEDEDIEALRALSDDPDIAAAAEDIIQQKTSNTTTLNVLQLETDLLDSITNLRSQEVNLQDSLDNYKFLLGLPTDYPLDVDDSLLEPFQFIPPTLTELEDSAIRFVEVTGPLFERVKVPNAGVLTLALEQIAELKKEVDERGLKLVRADLEALTETLDERIERLDDPADAQRLRDDIERDQRQFADVEARLEDFDVSLEQLAALLEEADRFESRADALVDPLAAETLRQQAAGLRRTVGPSLEVARDLLGQQISALTAILVGVRSDLVTVEPVDLGIEEAVAIGMENRLDLMNSRAIVTDQYRAMEIAKNQLKTVLNIVADGNIRTDNETNPFDFNSGANDYRLGVSFAAPLDRVAQRNNYRQAQIVYQRARRAYIAFEDDVKRDIRESWRGLQVERQNLETAKRQVRVAALQLDAAVEESTAPAEASRGGSGLQGQNLTRALGDILNAQNALIQIYTDYERNRLLLYQDMGIMEVGSDGVWNDSFYRGMVESDGAGAGFNDLDGVPFDPAVVELLFPDEDVDRFEEPDNDLSGRAVQDRDAMADGPVAGMSGLETWGDDAFDPNEVSVSPSEPVPADVSAERPRPGFSDPGRSGRNELERAPLSSERLGRDQGGSEVEPLFPPDLPGLGIDVFGPAEPVDSPVAPQTLGAGPTGRGGVGDALFRTGIVGERLR